MSDPRLLLLTVGDFGDWVGARLAARFPGSMVIDAVAGTHPAAWPTTDVLVVAAEYDHPELIEAVERAAFAWRRPWFPVLLDHPFLRCGPVVVPSRTACHRCFRRRRRQHARTPRLWADYPPPPLPGGPDRVRGWATHHVGLAAGLAVRAVGDAVGGDSVGGGPAEVGGGSADSGPAAGPGGWVRTVGLVDGAPHRASVVAVDGCERCRPARSDRDWLATVVAVDAQLATVGATRLSPVSTAATPADSEGGPGGW